MLLIWITLFTTFVLLTVSNAYITSRRRALKAYQPIEDFNRAKARRKRKARKKHIRR